MLYSLSIKQVCHEYGFFKHLKLGVRLYSTIKAVVPAISLTLFVILLTSSEGLTQTEKSNQFWSKYRLSHPFGTQWSSELDLNGRLSDTPEKGSMFSTRTRYAVQGWLHYHFSSRWRFSSMVGFFDVANVAELNQEKSQEWRFSLQALYFINKIGYTLNTRGRTEFRYINLDETGHVYSFRYRQQLKYQKPLNSKSFRKGVYYVVASDELFFRINSIEGESSFFDRNRLSLGGGYVLSDNIQIELAYVNEFLPRPEGNEVVNAIDLRVTFNNLLGQISQKFRKPKAEE